jgi:biotin carboxyl carrier protein
MKEYKYTINGNKYEVAIGEIVDNVAPLPGVITDILVEVGQEVEAGQNVIVLEAMKMANNLQTERAGKVTAICVKVGESVMEDDALVVIE